MLVKQTEGSGGLQKWGSSVKGIPSSKLSLPHAPTFQSTSSQGHLTSRVEPSTGTCWPRSISLKPTLFVQKQKTREGGICCSPLAGVAAASDLGVEICEHTTLDPAAPSHPDQLCPPGAMGRTGAGAILSLPPYPSRAGRVCESGPGAYVWKVLGSYSVDFGC